MHSAFKLGGGSYDCHSPCDGKRRLEFWQLCMLHGLLGPLHHVWQAAGTEARCERSQE